MLIFEFHTCVSTLWENVFAKMALSGLEPHPDNKYLRRGRCLHDKQDGHICALISSSVQKPGAKAAARTI